MVHWLVVNVWPTALRTTVSAVTGAIVAIIIIAPLKGAIKALRRRVSSVLDSLDPDVPVGLTKQLDDMQHALESMDDRMGHTLNVHPVHDLDTHLHGGK